MSAKNSVIISTASSASVAQAYDGERLGTTEVKLASGIYGYDYLLSFHHECLWNPE
jgi:hypothetical protein